MDQEFISWEDFQKVDIRIGTIVDAQDFPKARKPAYKLWVDLGEDLGTKKSSAQITNLYEKEDLIGKQVICICNFPPKQIADHMSEILVTGFYNKDGHVVLAGAQGQLENGAKLA